MSRVQSTSFTARQLIGVVHGVIALGLGGGARAGIEQLAALEAAGDDLGSRFEEIWSLPTLIDDPDAWFLQRLAIIGRYQGQLYSVESDQGDTSGYETRRLWLGGEWTMLQRLRFKVDVIWDMDNSDPLYHGLFEAYGSYSLSDSLSINAGRRKPPFTEEYRTSTKKILTFERSLLVNQVHPTNLAGTWVNGSVSGFSYDLGIYSGELDEAFGDLDAGAGALASIGYEFSGGGDGRRSRLGLDYLYNDGDSRNAQMKPYDHSLSLNYEGKYGGPFEVRSDLIYASGIDGASDVFGIVIMPAYHLTEKLQAVLRYQWATSDEVGGLKLQNRYERQVPGLVSTVGDEYHAVYTGLNYYIYGNKLKLMAGIEYSTMDQLGHSVGGFDGWTGFAGLRMYF